MGIFQGRSKGSGVLGIGDAGSQDMASLRGHLKDNRGDGRLWLGRNLFYWVKGLSQ